MEKTASLTPTGLALHGPIVATRGADWSHMLHRRSSDADVPSDGSRQRLHTVICASQDVLHLLPLPSTDTGAVIGVGCATNPASDEARTILAEYFADPEVSITTVVNNALSKEPAARRNAARYFASVDVPGRLAALVALSSRITCADVASLLLNGTVFRCRDAAANFAAVVVYARVRGFLNPTESVDTVHNAFRVWCDDHVAHRLAVGSKPDDSLAELTLRMEVMAAIKLELLRRCVECGVFESERLRACVAPSNVTIPFECGVASLDGDVAESLELCVACALASRVCTVAQGKPEYVGRQAVFPFTPDNGQDEKADDVTTQPSAVVIAFGGSAGVYPIAVVTSILCSNAALTMIDDSVARLDGAARTVLITPPAATGAVHELQRRVATCVASDTVIDDETLTVVRHAINDSEGGRVDIGSLLVSLTAEAASEWCATVKWDVRPNGASRVAPVRFPPAA